MAAALAALLFAGLEVPAGESKGGELRGAIEAATNKLVEAIGKGDAAAAAALYTTDAKIYSQHSGVVKGRKAIEEFFNRGTKAGAKTLKLTVGEVTGSGSTAVEIGKYTLQGEKDKFAVSGHYMAVWKKVGREWLIHREIANTDFKDEKAPKTP